MRVARAALVVIVVAGVLACAALTRPTAAAFTASGEARLAFTVDRLANYFAVAPGASTRPSTSTPVAAGDVDSQTLNFGTVPAAQSFASVFSVRNTTAQAQPAVLSLAGLPQLGEAVFTSTGTATDTIPAGATRTVRVATSPTVAGRGAGTLRLRLGSSTWLYRDYATTIDLAPQAPAALTATPRPAGAIRLSWPASTTVTGLAGYDVYRRSGTGAFAKLNAAPLAATTFDDTTTVNATSYAYVVRAATTAGVALQSVDSPTATATADAMAPSVPAAVALAGGATSVTAANAASLGIAVTLPAGSLATDTVTVTLTRGSTSLTRTVAAPAGAGTVTVAGIDVRGLEDGTITITAVSTDAAGNVSAPRTTLVAKDTTGPPAPTAYYSDREGNDRDVVWGSAPDAVSVRVERVSPSPAATYPAPVAYGWYAATVGAHRNATVTYRVTAVDAAGNESQPVLVTARTD